LNLENDRQEFQREKERWSEERERVRGVNAVDDVVELNVGGVTEGFQTTTRLLCSAPNSTLA